MNVLMRYLLFATLIGFLPCEAYAQDFSVRGSIEQKLDLENIEQIVLHCHCQNSFKRTQSVTGNFKLKISGTYDSVGYHGNQHIPSEMPSSMLDFTELRSNSTLTLISRERTFIHHAFLIDDLELIIPDSIDVQLRKVARYELEGRNIID